MCLEKKEIYIQDPSHALIKPQIVRWCSSPYIPEELKRITLASVTTAEGVHSVNPDNRIINFYNDTGRLGLHHDNKDDSRSSVQQSLPVISVTIGDTTKFVFGATSDKEDVSKVNLDSSGVLIFRRGSRIWFHGIFHMKPHTALTWLEEEDWSMPRTVEPHVQT